MYHPFNGAESLEDFEVRSKNESKIIDSEMIERGESALFVSVYDRLYLKNVKRKSVETKSDAEIVDDIFKSKLNKTKPKIEKPKGLAAFQKKLDVQSEDEPDTLETFEGTSNDCDIQFIISLFK